MAVMKVEERLEGTVDQGVEITRRLVRFKLSA
jgi:hypothetical protein